MPATSTFRRIDPLYALVNYWADCPFKSLIPSAAGSNAWTIHHWRSYSKPLQSILNDYITDYTSEHFYDEPRTEKSISTSDFGVIINQYVVPMYGEKWTRLYDALFAAYNPIHNYDMTESETKTNSGTITTDNTQTSNGSTTQTVNIYGYNSSDATPANNNTGTDDTTTTDKGSAETSASETRELTRAGNIGVTTSAQMIEGELNLRKTVFLGIVIEDLDDALTIGIYDDCIRGGGYI